FVEQVPVRGVQLEDPKAGAERALGRVAKGLDDARDALAVELLGHRVLGTERDRARRVDGTEAAVLPGLEDAAALPGRLRGSLPAGVRELHSRDGALPVDEAHDPSQLGNVLVLPDPQVLG